MSQSARVRHDDGSKKIDKRPIAKLLDVSPNTLYGRLKVRWLVKLE
jgi:hypothetical protein